MHGISHCGRANLELQIAKKNENIKTLKECGPENLSNPKFIEPKEITDIKIYELKLSLN